MSELSREETFRPGDRLDAYTLLCPLAVGGMGAVWTAALLGARGFMKVVAVKTILQELADEMQYARALRDEAQLAATLCHPHLCEVTHLGEARGFPYLVMEWVDGASLAELLSPGPRSESEPGRIPLDPVIAATIVADACAGLHALHEARDQYGRELGAVHRDVSPHNLLITTQGQIKLSDLGVAKARGQWRARTRSGELRGKLGYLAPEQLQGSGADRRTDVYALGCVLYLSVTGRLPFPPHVDAFELILKGKCRPAEEINPDVPRAISELIHVALSPRPEQRFRTAREMREVLDDWCAARSVQHGRRHIAACLSERLGATIKARNERTHAALARLLAQPAVTSE